MNVSEKSLSAGAFALVAGVLVLGSVARAQTCPPPAPRSTSSRSLCSPQTSTETERARYETVDTFTWRPLSTIVDATPIAGLTSTDAVECGVVRGGSGARPDLEVSNVREFARDVVWTNYYWQDDDGYQVTVWRETDDPKRVWINIAGSIPALAGPDVTTLLQNLWSESTVASNYPRLVLQVLQHLEETELQDGDTLFFSGHSQGGNVAQMVAYALATYHRTDGQAESAPFADGLTAGGIRQWPNVEPNTYRRLSQRLLCRNIKIGGGIAIASRPMYYWSEMNRLAAGMGQFFVFVNASNDGVPLIGSNAMWNDDPTAVAARRRNDLWTHDLRRRFTSPGVDVPVPGLNPLEVLEHLDLWMRLGIFAKDALPDVLANFDAAVSMLPGHRDGTSRSPRVTSLQERSHVYFIDTERSLPFDVHGQAYTDRRIFGLFAFQPKDDLAAIDLSDTDRVWSFPVLRNDFHGEVPADARITNVSWNEITSRGCFGASGSAAGALVTVSDDGKEIVLDLQDWGSYRCRGRSEDAALSASKILGDLQIEYTVNGAVRTLSLDAFGMQPVTHPVTGETTVPPAWAVASSSPFEGGPFHWLAPVGPGGNFVEPSLAALPRFMPSVRRSVHEPESSGVGLRFVAGYGADCFGGRFHGPEDTVPDDLGNDLLICRDDGSRNPEARPWVQRQQNRSFVDGIGAPPAERFRVRACRDGIPDTAWVRLEEPSSGTPESSAANAELLGRLASHRDLPNVRSPWDVLSATGTAPFTNRFWYSCEEPPDDPGNPGNPGGSPGDPNTPNGLIPSCSVDDLSCPDGLVCDPAQGLCRPPLECPPMPDDAVGCIECNLVTPTRMHVQFLCSGDWAIDVNDSFEHCQTFRAPECNGFENRYTWYLDGRHRNADGVIELCIDAQIDSGARREPVWGCLFTNDVWSNVTLEFDYRCDDVKAWEPRLRTVHNRYVRHRVHNAQCPEQNEVGSGGFSFRRRRPDGT